MAEPSTIHNERGKEALREIFKPYEDKPVSLRDLDCALYEIYYDLSWYCNGTDSAILQMSTLVEFIESGAAPLDFVQELAGLWRKPLPDEPQDADYMKIAQNIYEKTAIATDKHETDTGKYQTAHAYAAGKTIDATAEKIHSLGLVPELRSSRNRSAFYEYDLKSGRIDDTFRSLTDKVSTACGNFAEAVIRLKPFAEYVATGLASEEFACVVFKDMTESDLSHLANVIADCEPRHAMAPVLKLTRSFSLSADKGKGEEASDKRDEPEAGKEQGQALENNAAAHRKGR